MPISRTRQLLRTLPVALLFALSVPAQATLIANGGFESGFADWTRVDQIGSDGTFLLETGTASPVNGDPVPAPPEGATAAMSDAQGPGTHVLYQDFVVTGTVDAGTMLAFELFIGNRAGMFFSPAILDFSTPALNQQARVDILLATADPFSLAAADVLATLFQTNPGDPPVSGYTSVSAEVSGLLNAHVGELLRLRFAEVDNVSIFQLGVDDVRLVAPSVVSEPPPVLLLCGGLLVFLLGRGIVGRARAH